MKSIHILCNPFACIDSLATKPEKPDTGDIRRPPQESPHIAQLRVLDVVVRSCISDPDSRVNDPVSVDSALFDAGVVCEHHSTNEEGEVLHGVGVRGLEPLRPVQLFLGCLALGDERRAVFGQVLARGDVVVDAETFLDAARAEQGVG